MVDQVCAHQKWLSQRELSLTKDRGVVWAGPDHITTKETIAIEAATDPTTTTATPLRIRPDLGIDVTLATYR